MYVGYSAFLHGVMLVQICKSLPAPSSTPIGPMYICTTTALRIEQVSDNQSSLARMCAALHITHAM